MLLLTLVPTTTRKLSMTSSSSRSALRALDKHLVKVFPETTIASDSPPPHEPPPSGMPIGPVAAAPCRQLVIENRGEQAEPEVTTALSWPL